VWFFLIREFVNRINVIFEMQMLLFLFCKISNMFPRLCIFGETDRLPKEMLKTNCLNILVD